MGRRGKSGTPLPCLPPSPKATLPPTATNHHRQMPLGDGLWGVTYCWQKQQLSHSPGPEALKKAQTRSDDNSVGQLNSCPTLLFCSTTFSTCLNSKSARYSGSLNTEKTPIMLPKGKNNLMNKM